MNDILLKGKKTKLWMLWMFEAYFLFCNIGSKQIVQFKQISAFCLAGHLSTAAILSCPTEVFYIRIMPGTQHQQGQNDTLFKNREAQKPHPIPQHAPIYLVTCKWECPTPGGYYSLSCGIYSTVT